METQNARVFVLKSPVKLKILEVLWVWDQKEVWMRFYKLLHIISTFAISRNFYHQL